MDEEAFAFDSYAETLVKVEGDEFVFVNVKMPTVPQF